MLNQIIFFSIKNKPIILLMTAILVVWGVWSANRLPVDAVPDITNNQVQIITICPTLAAQEVEQFVTYPIEQAMANLPDLVELRSISRFGLSVVTIVFAEDVDIWFARQIVGERMREAEDLIPEGIGKPELAPVSTGLGEIYQYVIHPREGSEDKYTGMDLRTMQDWIVARQLYGTPGVAEVNGFGGILKQYEVAINPDRLRAMGVSIPEIFHALENNNENTGGAYIDKKPNAWFIRGIGLVHSLEDIRNIIVKLSANGIPILINDVAEVRFGSAVRYGALTYNGEKEAVGGMVMMLKGANSAEVVARVKEKMVTIQRSLPEDVIIEPFLDRTNLVERAISTVEKNLVEGALIVIFVLVVFLGNLRAGMIVASAIPLSMLFALGMMNVFGVSANLMSLGAIDFGLIVDGAVIIVEATLHHLGLRQMGRRFTQEEMDQEVFHSASRIRNSAAFGEIIILVVYIPILTLVGIEGKMFTPMAQTVGFAIFGALLLSVTYIPMMCAWFLPKQMSTDPGFSGRMIQFFQRLYAPVLAWAIRFKRLVVGLTIGIFILSLFLFSRIGGEFIPQLEEGDYAFHCILPMGSSLSQSIETSMQAQRLLKSFPEVKMVVGKTGSAEVPTDPMPPEATDMMIILKDKSEWTTTQDYQELARLMLKKLETIPGIFFEANQPIQMRFNELMTGIRQDVAVKIFGENIDTLAALAPRISTVLQTVEGISTPQVEQTIGLPQITIQYDRNRLANYGISVEDVNHTVSTAFAGEKAGVVFENERRFDLVVRLDSMHRSSFEDVGDLFVATPSGNQIPLDQVATVTFQQGPAQISRDDGKRRIVIGFNVEGRDVQSVVEEIQIKLQGQVQLPEGYYTTFGGTFENYERANARLRVVVPIALALIFLLLYFTFHSVKLALLIFTAIPMSAIGGVFALMIRGMPFSISAGVGFIALFGVAVLNGIVLIATFHQLKKDGVDNVLDQVIEGTRIRLRPVLMTAMVASFGFLPMALSTGAGAEVQKPLATVVIGGLITATFLTLVVLPLLYLMLADRKRMGFRPKSVIPVLLALLFFGSSGNAFGQSPSRMTLEAVIQKSREANLPLQVGQLEVQRNQALAGTWLELPKTGVFVENEDLRPGEPMGIWKIGLSQSMATPGLYKARKTQLNDQVRMAETRLVVQEAELIRDVSTAYYQLWYLENKKVLYQTLDSLYTGMSGAAAVRNRAGESSGLDRLAAEARSQEIRMILGQMTHDIAVEAQTLQLAMNTEGTALPLDEPLGRMEFPVTTSPGLHPVLQNQQAVVDWAESGIRVQQKALLPEYSGRVFSQRLYGIDPPFTGFSFTIGVPLASKSGRKKIEAARIEHQMQSVQLQAETAAWRNMVAQSRERMIRSLEALQYYETFGLNQSNAILEAAQLSYENGEISVADWLQFVAQAVAIKQSHLDALNDYNQLVIQYQYILGK
ncbi:MAG: CusA/CzcA family heavy metal efflux RND transporter [Saprospiraceae bacterium]|nr:CusA/CzcA family heavy metal efflux RND transporter [Saprospiraceae bacterium]